MAAIDFPASPTVGQVFNAANGSSYTWNGTLWVPTGVSGSQIAIGDTPPANPNPGQLWFNSALGQLFIWYTDGTSNQWVPTNPVPVVAAMQTVSTQTGAMATGTPLIPADDTIPQISEGTEFMTLVVTPKSATSTLYIDVNFFGSHSVAGALGVALFQDAIADALACVSAQNIANGLVSIKYTHIVASGSMTTRTYRVRAGGSAAGTTTFNGFGGARRFGGVASSSIVATEAAS